MSGNIFMNCINFEKEIIVSLTPKQKKHMQTCRECRRQWQELFYEQAVVNAFFDQSKELVVDIMGKPPSDSWLTPAFLEQLQKAKIRQEKAAGTGAELSKYKEII